MRNSLVCTVVNQGVHFCSPVANQEFGNPFKLQGSDYNLVFPLQKVSGHNDPDFTEIERIMVMNKIAHNVTSIRRLRDNGQSTDFEITYNEWQEVTAAA